ncbi:MAG: hypothetical protein LBC84_04600, partial [Prevotellaceae bacterium]|nr:hypothetical protein [Prevotellaceae bacterium]
MKRLLYFLLFGAVFTRCTQMDAYLPEPVYYRVIESMNTGKYDLGKYEDGLESFAPVVFFLDNKLIFRVTAIEYETIDPNGKPVLASGLVFHPINRKSKGVVDALPIARLGGDGASVEMYAAEGLMAMAGYTVILPDLLGFGVSKDQVIPPFLMTENTGRVAYDMRCAAAQFLWDEFRYALPAETIIMGYSLGGSAALSTQKYYETHHADKVKIKEVHAGGGAYDLPAAFAAFAKTKFSDYPAIPHTILAFNHYYDLHLDFSQIFTGRLLEVYEDWYEGEYDNLDNDISTYMHPDFFLPLDLQNDEFIKLQPYLIKNSVS